MTAPLTFTFHVDFSTNDHIKDGITVLGTSLITVLADTLNDASLTACQMVGLGAYVPTDCRLLEVVA